MQWVFNSLEAVMTAKLQSGGKLTVGELKDRYAEYLGTLTGKDARKASKVFNNNFAEVPNDAVITYKDNLFRVETSDGIRLGDVGIGRNQSALSSLVSPKKRKDSKMLGAALSQQPAAGPDQNTENSDNDLEAQRKKLEEERVALEKQKADLATQSQTAPATTTPTTETPKTSAPASTRRSNVIQVNPELLAHLDQLKDPSLGKPGLYGPKYDQKFRELLKQKGITGDMAFDPASVNAMWDKYKGYITPAVQGVPKLLDPNSANPSPVVSPITDVTTTPADTESTIPAPYDPAKDNPREYMDGVRETLKQKEAQSAPVVGKPTTNTGQEAKLGVPRDVDNPYFYAKKRLQKITDRYGFFNRMPEELNARVLQLNQQLSEKADAWEKHRKEILSARQKGVAVQEEQQSQEELNRLLEQIDNLSVTSQEHGGVIKAQNGTGFQNLWAVPGAIAPATRLASLTKYQPKPAYTRTQLPITKHTTVPVAFKPNADLTGEFQGIQGFSNPVNPADNTGVQNIDLSTSLTPERKNWTFASGLAELQKNRAADFGKPQLQYPNTEEPVVGTAAVNPGTAPADLDKTTIDPNVQYRNVDQRRRVPLDEIDLLAKSLLSVSPLLLKSKADHKGYVNTGIASYVPKRSEAFAEQLQRIRATRPVQPMTSSASITALQKTADAVNRMDQEQKLAAMETEDINQKEMKALQDKQTNDKLRMDTMNTNIQMDNLRNEKNLQAKNAAISNVLQNVGGLYQEKMGIARDEQAALNEKKYMHDLTNRNPKIGEFQKQWQTIYQQLQADPNNQDLIQQEALIRQNLQTEVENTRENFDPFVERKLMKNKKVPLNRLYIPMGASGWKLKKIAVDQEKNEIKKTEVAHRMSNDIAKALVEKAKLYQKASNDSVRAAMELAKVMISAQVKPR